MPPEEPFELDKDVEDFFKNASSVHNAPELPDPALAAPPSEPPAPAATPPAPAPAAAPTAPTAPVEDPALVALRNQLGQLQNYSAQLEQAMQALQNKQPTAPAAPVPDPETDPLGHVMHELGETKKMIAQLTERFSQQDAASQQTNELRSFAENVQSMTAAFIQKQADYGDAYNYLRAVRTQDMKDLGVPVNQIPGMLLKEELAVASRAMNQGINPAQMVYNIATRYGYKPSATPQPPAARMENLQKGAAAAPTPVDPAASGPALTIESVKDMTGDQLDKLVDSNDLWAKVVGGKAGGDSIFH